MDPHSVTPNIADRYADLIAQLSPRRHRGLIARLSQEYFDGWRPSRDEVAALVAQDLRKAPDDSAPSPVGRLGSCQLVQTTSTAQL